MGEGISPDKNQRHLKRRAIIKEDEDPETQQNKEKTRRILENFDFNKLFYPSHCAESKQRNAKSLNEGRRRTKNDQREDL